MNAGEIFGRHMEGIADDHVMELRHIDRKRIFNLGYYTWVEQQGVSIEDFDRRKNQEFLALARRQHPGLGPPDPGIQR